MLTALTMPGRTPATSGTLSAMVKHASSQHHVSSVVIMSQAASSHAQALVAVPVLLVQPLVLGGTSTNAPSTKKPKTSGVATNVLV